MSKKLYALLSVLVLVSMMLSACGGAATPTAAKAVTLKIYLLDYTPDTIAWLKSDINPAFEAAHPGVTVEITEGSCLAGIPPSAASSPLALAPTSSTSALR